MYNYNLMKHILQRIDSRHLAKLWSFYRNYFSDDTSCLQFLYASLENEPVNDGTIYHEAETGNKLFIVFDLPSVIKILKTFLFAPVFISLEVML